MALASIADLIKDEDREVFLADKAKPNALAMFFVVLGEAANKVSPVVKAAYPELAWRYAARLRHLIAHEYQRVDHQQLWEFATLDAPEMLAHLPAAPTGTTS